MPLTINFIQSTVLFFIKGGKIIILSQIENLKPESVFQFFREISQIPRGSGNTKAIAEYCIDFAKKRNLKFASDSYGNVVIYSDGTEGYEDSETIILQAHIDMVCEKDQDSQKNMKTDSIDICTDGKYLWADGTTLGGDDGIGVTYILAILDSDSIPHPPIEALFTTDEEIGLLGASNLDASLLSGKRLINIDSEEEGILTVSCAGGIRSVITFPLKYSNEFSEKCAVKITVNGLIGGHSGVDIDKHRKNAIKVLSHVLEGISQNTDYRICEVSGGTKENIIPKEAQATICFEKKYSDTVFKTVEKFNTIIKKECLNSEPDVCINSSVCVIPEKMFDRITTKKIIFTLMHAPDGIATMSHNIPGFVESSLNLGYVWSEKNDLKMGVLIRSNTSTGKTLIVQRLSSFAEYIGGKAEYMADYPEWEYKADSPLRDIMSRVYKDVYNDEALVCGIHAGLECGILSDKLKNADIVSFGPDIENAHTTGERLNIESAQRCWKYLKAVLKELK